jgi:hypothetical protein
MASWQRKSWLHGRKRLALSGPLRGPLRVLTGQEMDYLELEAR